MLIDTRFDFLYDTYVNSIALPAPAVSPRLAEHMALILDALRRAAAARAAKWPTLVPVVLLLWPYLHRAAGRFERLLARHDAGRVTPPRTRPPGAGPSRDRPSSDRPLAEGPSAEPGRSRRPGRLPGGFAWLRELVPATGGPGSQLQHLLRDPAMAELLEVAPQAGRILRPLCRMLGIGPGPDVPPALFPPRRAKQPPPLALRPDAALGAADHRAAWPDPVPSRAARAFAREAPPRPVQVAPKRR